MIYLLFKWLQRVSFRLFFKHIHIANLKNIPTNKPVVIACNHPGAFMDPGFIGSIIPKSIHFTTRGDAFANPVVRIFLKGLHLNPVYRFDEGFENLSKNFETIEDLTDILKNNGIVLIFSEGYGAVDRRLRPLLKGTARIFLQIASEHNLDIELYAVGITYTHKKNFRKSILCSFSKPLFLKDYLTDFISHKQRGYHTFSKELSHRISENFVVVYHKECDELVDRHINYFCSTEKLPLLPIVFHNRKKLDQLQALSKSINYLYTQAPNEYQNLKEKTEAYEKALYQNKVTDFGLVNNPLPLYSFLLMLLFLPFSLIGGVFWGIPLLVAKWIADKTVTRVDFYDSVQMNSLMLLYAMFVVTANIFLAFNIGWWSLLVYILAPACGELTFWTYDALSNNNQVRKARSCQLYSNLLSMRRQVVDFQV